MPIRDRTRRRLVRLGVIRLGYKKERTYPNGRKVTYPVQADHFVLKDAPEIAAFYHERGIEKVRELDVYLPFPDVERNFDAWYQVWAGGVLVCQGDGERIQYATPHRCSQDKKGKTHVHNAPGDTLVSNGVAQIDFSWNGDDFVRGEIVPCPGRHGAVPYPHCAVCKLNGVLKVMMADEALFRLGYYQISTGSGRNHDTILGMLEAMPANRLNGFPFKLRMVEEQTTYIDDGQRKTTKKWFLQLEPDPVLTRQLYQRQVAAMIAGPMPVAAIPATVDQGPDWNEYEGVDDVLPPPLAQDQAPDEPATDEVIDNDEEPKETAKHWIEDAEIHARFWEYAGKLGMDDVAVLHALNAERVESYPGSMASAKVLLDAWAESAKHPTASETA